MTGRLRRSGLEERMVRRHVADVQRARILSATLDACSEKGAANITVADVVGRAGVSRRTFYELFDGWEECVLAALDHTIERVGEHVLVAYEAHTSWRERIRAGLTALLWFLDEEHSTGWLLIVDSLAAGPRALERRSRVLEMVKVTIEEGQMEGRARVDPFPLTAEGIVGGVLSVIHRRIVEGSDRPLTELVNPLMSMIVLPYLGPAAARKESERAEVVPARASRQKSNPFSELDMRLTYRTMRVLSTIADQPGASNREVGRAAGMVDQGQVSKLLARLQGAGLIESRDAGVKGTPNAWVLTRKGSQVERAIATYSESSAD
jgi:AcrR family transcriptional regulator/DNA-binding MarR family transcriptional regulator